MPVMPAPAPAAAPGPTAPAAVPGQNPALRLRGRVLTSVIMASLTQAIQLLGADSDDGRIAIKALATLSGHFGKAEPGLQQSEVKMLGEQAAPVARPAPQQLDAFQQMIRQRQAGMGMGAPSPAPAPPMTQGG